MREPLDLNQLVSLHHLDHMPIDDALQLVSRLREWTNELAAEQTSRARVEGRSWRSIADSLSMSPTTARRWALWGSPEAPRERSRVAS